jgi:hypothetical protein
MAQKIENLEAKSSHECRLIARKIDAPDEAIPAIA